MVFASNPLSLSVPEPAFESWLRDSGYLEILDQRTSDIHRLTTTSTNSTTATSTTDFTPCGTATTNSTTDSFFSYIFSYFGTLVSLFTLNPFSKLTTEDFSGETPSWTLGFVGSCDSYSFPSSPTQARLRVHENVKRYARNYASLFILAFACTLYQMPLALVGLISCFALWDLFKYCSNKWGLDQFPVTCQCVVRAVQCAGAVILVCSNVQMAIFCALGVSYAVMLLHAALRKLTVVKQPTRGRWK